MVTKIKLPKSHRTTKVAGIDFVVVPFDDYIEMMKARKFLEANNLARVKQQFAGRPSRIDHTPGMADFIKARLGKMILGDILSALVEEFGQEACPSLAALSRFSIRCRAIAATEAGLAALQSDAVEVVA